ncbi:MAG: phosphodiester glycosidase family protein [Legionellales bacterium]|nr:phosphodiester glycosidase family protein [Legionellales bacterium]
MKFIYGLICTLTMTFSLPAYAQTQWQVLQPGLEYAAIALKTEQASGKLHAFRFQLTDYQLHLAFAQDLKRKATTVRQLATHQRALVAINGGFFSPDHTMLGLRIQDGHQLSPLQATSWWGVFYIKKGKPRIVSQRQYHANDQINLAIQSGPRLLINGRIPKLKPGLAERSVICIDHKQRILLAITQNVPITTEDLAEQLRQPTHKGGLGCYQALNLDGGHSSQLFAHVDQFRLSITGFSAVTDALIVLPTANAVSETSPAPPVVTIPDRQRRAHLQTYNYF